MLSAGAPARGRLAPARGPHSRGVTGDFACTSGVGRGMLSQSAADASLVTAGCEKPQDTFVSTALECDRKNL